jgi:phenylacetate-CoA ligase
MDKTPPQSKLPLYIHSIDWDAHFRDSPPPDVWYDTMFKWSRDELRAYQNVHFMSRIGEGWNNAFYHRLWREAGLEPGDIASLDDIDKLPIFNSDDVKRSQEAHPPFGEMVGIDVYARAREQPLRIITSGGTTGTPRPSVFSPLDWEYNGLYMARCLYAMGARPGDRVQLPVTLSLLNYGWSVYHACHYYLGAIPITTGTGIVTPTLRQIETAFQFSTNVWSSFPEYLTQLAITAREMGRDVRELNTKFIQTWLGPDIDGSLRAYIEELWGCPAYDGYGTHEAGGIGFEGPDKDGIYLQEDAGVFQFVDPDTLVATGAGEPGNIVHTHLHRRVPLLIRYDLRDFAQPKPQTKSALGSNMLRLDRFLGRSDQMVKLRGTNVWPMACLSAVRSDDRTTGEWVCIVRRWRRNGVLRDEMTVKVECRNDGRPRDGLSEILERRLLNDLAVSVEVLLVDEGNLPEANIGKEGKPRRLVDERDIIREG